MLAYVLEVKVVDSVQLAPLALDHMYYICILTFITNFHVDHIQQQNPIGKR